MGAGKPDNGFMAIELPERCAQRHALVNKFHEASKKRVICVMAKPGSGKSVATMLWAKNAGRRISWARLTERDNMLMTFYRTFCSALLALQPDNVLLKSIVSNPALASSPVDYALEAVAALNTDAGTYAFVMDDMSLVTDKELLKSFSLVIRRLPDSFVCVMLTKADAEEENTRTLLASLSECHVRYASLTYEDLAFNSEEIRKHYEVYGQVISEDEAKAIYAACEGWPVCVNALAASGMKKVELRGDRLLESYIEKCLWDTWDEDTKHFLISTATAEEITVDHASLLVNSNESATVLETLCQQTFFVSRVGASRYRYHQLFLAFLQKKLEQADPVMSQNLYRRSAEYHLSRNEIFLARRCALKSGDAEIIAQASLAVGGEEGSDADIAVEEFVSIYRCFFGDEIPEQACRKHPYLYSQYAGYYLLVGDKSRAEHCFDGLIKNVAAITVRHSQFLPDVLLMLALDYRTELNEMLKHVRALPFLPELSGRLQWSTITGQLPFAHRSSRDFSELSDLIVQERVFSKAVPLLGDRGAICAPLIRAGLLCEQNELEAAHDTLQVAERCLHDATRGEFAFCLLMQTAALYAARGANEELADLLAQGEDFVERKRNGHHRANFEAFRTRIALMDGDIIQAKAWLGNYYVVEGDRLELFRIFQHFTTARAYLVLGRIDDAAHLIDRLKEFGQNFMRALDIAEASVLKSILLWAIGKQDEAVEELECVLAITQQHGFVRVIADEGASILPVLKRLLALAEKEAGSRRIEMRYLKQVLFAAYEQASRTRGVTSRIAPAAVKLSKRQRLVLELLSRGYRTTGIAEKTGLTISTVKFHLSAAYKKLGVNNALDAVLKAKESGAL